jgi:hypothetical protein
MIRIDHPGSLRFGQVGSDGQRPPAVLLDFMGAQNVEWVFVVAVNNRRELLQWHLCLHGEFLLVR